MENSKNISSIVIVILIVIAIVGCLYLLLKEIYKEPACEENATTTSCYVLELEVRSPAFEEGVIEGQKQVGIFIFQQLNQTGELVLKIGTTTDDDGNVIDRKIKLRPVQ